MARRFESGENRSRRTPAPRALSSGNASRTPSSAAATVAAADGGAGADAGAFVGVALLVGEHGVDLTLLVCLAWERNGDVDARWCEMDVGRGDRSDERKLRRSQREEMGLFVVLLQMCGLAC